MTDQLGLGGNLDVSDTFGGQIAALGMKARQAGTTRGLGLKPKQAPKQAGQIASTTKPPARSNRPDLGNGSNSILDMFPKDPNAKPIDPQLRAKLESEVLDMFTPVEQGGCLRTTASPARMANLGNGQLTAAPLPEGYSWTNLPKAIQAKIQLHLPPGVKPVGFEPSYMSEMQNNTKDWFDLQKDDERQAEADQMQAQQQQQASPDASKP